MASYDPLGGYVTNPGTQSGSGAYGSVPGAINIPPNIYQQLGTVDPQLAAQTGSLNETILNELQGELSPETINQMQQKAAQFGVSSGMPASQFAGQYGQYMLGQNVEQNQRQGIQDYLSMLKGVGATLTPQQLAAEIASRNATMSAAPNPAAAAQQQMQDWQNRFNQMAGSTGTGASPAGGTTNRGTLMPGSGGSPSLGNATNNWPSSGGGGPTEPTTNAVPGGGYAPVNLTGNTYGNVSPTQSGQGEIIDANGDAWIQYNGQWMNLSTGEMSNSVNGYSPTSHGSMYMGPNPNATPSDSASFLQQYGIDSNGLDQATIDWLAGMYGYTQSPGGSTGAFDLGGVQGGVGAMGYGGYDPYASNAGYDPYAWANAYSPDYGMYDQGTSATAYDPGTYDWTGFNDMVDYYAP
jgi:hypothetical protein